MYSRKSGTFALLYAKINVKSNHFLFLTSLESPLHKGGSEGVWKYRWLRKYGKFMLNEVLEAGNFGRHDARNRFGKTQLGHNLQRVYRDIRLVKYFTAEAMSEPLFRTWHFFWRVKNKK